MLKKIKNFEAWNEEMAKKYNPDKYHHSSNLIIRFIEKKRTDKIIDYLNPQQQDKIIELGCGAGNIMERIKTAKELWGVDLSDFLLRLAQQKSYQTPVKFIKGNIENLPDQIVKVKFDKIYCSEVLEHLENPTKVLREIKKIAKEDSVVVISIPNEKLINKIKNILQKLRIFTLLFPKISQKMDDEWHLHSFDLDKLKQMVSQDYLIQEVRGIPYNFLPLRYVVKLRVRL
jgi:2-polyprenyl-3-methyl-5-hydroxy-6-metoxy-1,4-benzoquinol methylase